MMVAHRRDRPDRARPLRPICRASSHPGDLVVVNTSAHPPGRRCRRPPRTADARRAPLDPTLPTASVARRAPAAAGAAHRRRSPARARATGSRSPAAARRSTCATVRRRAAPVGRPPRPAGAARRATWRRHGRPIRYGYVAGELAARRLPERLRHEPGSAEMPSAGRPFTAELVTALVARGVGVAPLVLHTGVSSLEADEPPLPRALPRPGRDRRSASNAARGAGGRVVAVGTTVVRALETRGRRRRRRPRPAEGWTDLVITPERGVRAVDGLLTGWHEPEASHLLMLEAVAGRGAARPLATPPASPHGYLLARVRRRPPDPAVT